MTSGIQATYQNFELYDLAALPDIIAMHQLDGFNVTIPYKEKVIAFLDEMDITAQQTGAVNCVRVQNGKCKGYNTDIIGFEQSLLSFINKKRINALVFGNGGASKAVRYVLDHLQINYLIVSRNDIKDAIMYADLTPSILADYPLLINTTPVGTYPSIQDKLPLPYHLINEDHYAYDLIYNPEKTAFLLNCEQQGAQIKNGFDMLTIQAEASYKIFTM